MIKFIELFMNIFNFELFRSKYNGVGGYCLGFQVLCHYVNCQALLMIRLKVEASTWFYIRVQNQLFSQSVQNKKTPKKKKKNQVLKSIIERRKFIVLSIFPTLTKVINLPRTVSFHT